MRLDMKIITKCIIDIKSSKVIHEESYDYSGPISYCSGGGGGGSSGAVSWPAYLESFHGELLNNAGTVHMLSSITNAMNAAIGASPWVGAVSYDPTTDLDESKASLAAFAAIVAGIDEYTSWSDFYTQAITSIGEPTELAIDDVVIGDIVIDDLSLDDREVDDMADVDGITETDITTDVAAFADQLDDEINTKVLPRFRRGMQNINAVTSSSYVIGLAVIEGFRDRDVAKHSSALRLEAAKINAGIELDVGRSNLGKEVDITKLNMSKDIDLAKLNMTKDIEVDKTNVDKDIAVSKSNILKDIEVNNANFRSLADYKKMYMEATSQMFQLMIQKVSWDQDYAKLTIESNRIKIVAIGEYYKREDTINESDALWDLEMFQYGANLLAGPSGGVKNTKGDKPDTAASMIGGGLGGAATGALIGSKIGQVGSYWGAAAGAVLGAAAGYFGSR